MAMDFTYYGLTDSADLREINENFQKLENALTSDTQKKIYSGIVAVSAEGGAKGTADVVFPEAFSHNPAIVPGQITGYPELRQVSISTRSTTGFTITLYNGASGAVTQYVSWIAVGD